MARLCQIGRRGRNAAGRKHDQAAALHQMRLGLGARVQVGLQRLFGFGEIDGQQKLLHLLGAQKHGIGEHAEILAHATDDLADDEAVQHAERMIGDDDERPGLRPRRERVFVVDELEFQLLNRCTPEVAVGWRVRAVVEIKPLQVRLASGAFDQVNQRAFDPRVCRRGVGKRLPRRNGPKPGVGRSSGAKFANSARRLKPNLVSGKTKR